MQNFLEGTAVMQARGIDVSHGVWDAADLRRKNLPAGGPCVGCSRLIALPTAFVRRGVVVTLNVDLWCRWCAAVVDPWPRVAGLFAQFPGRMKGVRHG